MATITVLPRDDGHDFQESWMVHKNGQMQSNHTTKAAARNAARELVSEGDTLEIRRTDGSIQERKTVRKGSNQQKQENEDPFGLSIPGIDGGYGEGTLDEQSGFFE